MRQKGYTSILIIIIIALVVVAGAYYFRTKISGVLPTPTGNPVSSATNTPTKITSTTELSTDPTVNWKTYTNQDYNFSFKYPSDWKLNCMIPSNDNWLDRNICDITAPDTIMDHGQIVKGSYFVISVSKPNQNYANFSEYITYSSSQFGYNYINRTINNINGKIAIRNGVNTNYLFESRGYVISTSWMNDQDSKVTEDILSTLSFIE